MGSLCEAYREVARFDQAGHWVNLLFDHETPELEIQSPYTHPHLGIRLKRPGPLHLRLPPWLDPAQIEIAGPASLPQSIQGYTVFSDPAIDHWITFDFALPVHELTLEWRELQTRARFRGDEVIAMDNFGTDLTFFEAFD